MLLKVRLSFIAALRGQNGGSISLHQSQNPRLAHSAGLGMMVHPEFWGQGIGSRLMETVLDLADNWLNLKRVELEVNVLANQQTNRLTNQPTNPLFFYTY